MKFTKMHGIGNDYIYINAIEQQIDDPNALALKLSDRRFSIGGDGVILICKSDVADAKMRMFNADGSEGKMCGNGVRCVGKYVYDNLLSDKSRDTITIETLSGIKTLKITAVDGKAELLEVDMGKAELNASEIPVIYEGSDTVIAKPLVVNGVEHIVTCVSMGNPHCVTFVDDVDSLELEKVGPHFENHAAFPERINTEFVKVVDDKTLQMRVWERGSGETWACGTGACATAVAACENGYCKKGENITVHLRGGDLIINYTDERVLMTGPATKVFDGEIEV
ncbi:MAG: diaminopimelate epimerase [Ruminococcaceae bacterium]|nr:diaminopimelate epimerase [Oscillospiraceae bacterium]